MNKFSTFEGNKEHLTLGDVVSWEDGKFNEYIIYQLPNDTIGLLDTETTNSCPTTFSSLEKLELYLQNKKVTNNEIGVINFNEWCVYVP